jgi:predicted nucleic acid-binding protein
MQKLLDASAVMAVILEEEGRAAVANMVEDADIVSPEVLPFEIGNGLTKLMKRRLHELIRVRYMCAAQDAARNRGYLSDADMQKAFSYYQDIPIKLLRIDISEALKIAWKYNIYAYDAYYLEAAKRLTLPLVTLDVNMRNQARDLGITVLEEENADG